MKILKLLSLAIVAVVGLTVLALAVSGRREGAGQLKGAVDVDVPADRLRPWLTEPEKLKQWVGWLVEVRPAGPKREVWVLLDANNNNERMEIQAETLEDTPRLLRARLVVPESFEGTSEFRLTELGPSRTRMEQVETFHYASVHAVVGAGDHKRGE